MNLAWIVVEDLQKAIDYYVDVVGLKLTEEHAEFGWAELQGTEGGAILGLAQMQDENLKPGSNAVMTLSVEDIEASKSDLESKGTKMVGDVVEVPGMCKLQLFADADGNLMQLHQTLELAVV